MTPTALLLVLAASTTPLVHGHRGARAVLPENTLPALEHALDVGADLLELDLGVTKDGHLVLLHDQEVSPERCTRASGARLKAPIPVFELTLAELQDFDCGRLKNPRFPRQRPRPNTRVPTFSDVLSWLNASQHPRAALVHINAETKIVPGRPGRSPSAEVFARLFVDAVRRHDFVERTVLQSFDHRVLLAAAELEPRLRRAALFGESHPDYLAAAKAVKAHIVSPHHEWITADAVRALKAANIEVHPWTANTPAAWERLIAMGVDGIITDDPAALKAHLAARASR